MRNICVSESVTNTNAVRLVDIQFDFGEPPFSFCNTFGFVSLDVKFDEPP